MIVKHRYLAVPGKNTAFCTSPVYPHTRCCCCSCCGWSSLHVVRPTCQ